MKVKAPELPKAAAEETKKSEGAKANKSSSSSSRASDEFKDLVGSTGTVVGYDQDRVVVDLDGRGTEPPFGLAIARAVQDKFAPSTQACKSLGIRPDVLGKIAGNLICYIDTGAQQSGGGRGDRGPDLRGTDLFDLGLRLRVTSSEREKLRVLGYVRHTSMTSEELAKRAAAGDVNCWDGEDVVRIVGAKAAGEGPEQSLVGEPWSCNGKL